MIYVNRTNFPIPAVFDSEEVMAAKREMEAFYAINKEQRSQQRYYKAFEHSVKEQFLTPLREVFNGKCAYCESSISVEKSSEYDHFRPKNGAKGFENESQTDYYWWLTYEWDNLYYCCDECNRYKSTWFPVIGDRVVKPYKETVEIEKPLLVDPCIDNPELHFIFDDAGKIDFLTERGKTTIELLKLDRSDLVLERHRTALNLKRQWQNLVALIGMGEKRVKETERILYNWNDILSGKSDSEYLALQRHLVNGYLNDPTISKYLKNKGKNATEESISIKTELYSQKTATKKQLSRNAKAVINKKSNIDNIKHSYVESIEVRNFLCFTSMKLDFNKIPETTITNKRPSNNEPWVLFLGDNGAGKSSLLKAFVIGLSGQKYINNLPIQARKLLRHKTSKGFIKINFVGEKEPITVTLDRDKNTITSSIATPAVNLVAYSSIRLKPEKGKLIPEDLNDFDGAKAKNIFDHTNSLVNAEKWLAELPKERFDEAALTLKDLMLLNAEDLIKIKKQAIYVKRGDEDLVPIEELSDGYKSIFYLAVDIMATLADRNARFDLAEGMVFIDEIGTHLHPRWRMEVVGRMRKAFPKIRFVVTTHEPLCLRGLFAGETIVVTKNQDKEIIAINELPDPSELRVDQLLTSDFFGLKSTIDPQTEQIFNEYYAILALEDKDRTVEQKSRILELSRLIPKIKHLGDSLREELVYYVIDELLAKKARTNGLQNKDVLKQEAVKRVASLWNTIDAKNTIR